MKTAELEIVLIPLNEEVPTWDLQDEFKQIEEELQSKQVLIHSRPRAIPPGYVAGPADLLSGEFILNLIPTVGPIVGAVTGAWLHARYGRKVRIKIGDIEVEAQSPAEVEKLLEKAQTIQQRSQAKKILEP